MNTEILEIVRKTINEVNNGHAIYNRDEVTNILWNLESAQTALMFPAYEAKEKERTFTETEVQIMLQAYGRHLIHETKDYIESMDTEIDTDEIEIDDYDDFDIQIGSNHRIELEYEGSFNYNGKSPSEIVIDRFDNEYDYDMLDEHADQWLIERIMITSVHEETTK
jgi:hypothetical protein